MQANSPNESLNSYPVALDYQATTPCDKEVLRAMEPYWNNTWGNASSRQHHSGLQAAAAIKLAREKLASFFRVEENQIIFTSGATEANNLALIGHARAKAKEKGEPGHIITLSTEHHAVLDPLRQLKKEGFRLTEITPEEDGLVSINKVASAFEKDTLLASVMIANNEIGVIQPIREISELCRKNGVTLHSDAAQAFGYLPMDQYLIDIDLISISSHKIYGPKGIGALILNKKVPLTPLSWGGGQEQGLRPGTLPVPLIIGLAKAAELRIEDLPRSYQQLSSLRNQLWVGLKQHLPNLLLNGSLEKRLPNNLNFSVPDINGNQLFRNLRPLVECSSGSACSMGKPSHVLISLGRSPAEAQASLRLSLGKDTNQEEVQRAIKAIINIVQELSDH